MFFNLVFYLVFIVIFSILTIVFAFKWLTADKISDKENYRAFVLGCTVAIIVLLQKLDVIWYISKHL